MRLMHVDTLLPCFSAGLRGETSQSSAQLRRLRLPKHGGPQGVVKGFLWISQLTGIVGPFGG